MPATDSAQPWLRVRSGALRDALPQINVGVAAMRTLMDGSSGLPWWLWDKAGATWDGGRDPGVYVHTSMECADAVGERVALRSAVPASGRAQICLECTDAELTGPFTLAVASAVGYLVLAREHLQAAAACATSVAVRLDPQLREQLMRLATGTDTGRTVGEPVSDGGCGALCPGTGSTALRVRTHLAWAASCGASSHPGTTADDMSVLAEWEQVAEAELADLVALAPESVVLARAKEVLAWLRERRADVEAEYERLLAGVQGPETLLVLADRASLANALGAPSPQIGWDRELGMVACATSRALAFDDQFLLLACDEDAGRVLVDVEVCELPAGFDDAAARTVLTLCENDEVGLWHAVQATQAASA